MYHVDKPKGKVMLTKEKIAEEIADKLKELLIKLLNNEGININEITDIELFEPDEVADCHNICITHNCEYKYITIS